MARRRTGSLLPSADNARSIALAIGAMRIGVGAGFLAGPVFSVRMLGVDTATASRLTFLARMAAARDGALGVGTVYSALRGQGAAAWLLAGGFCDACDALFIGLSAGKRKLDPVRGGLVAASAAGAAATAALTAAALPS